VKYHVARIGLKQIKRHPSEKYRFLNYIMLFVHMMTENRKVRWCYQPPSVGQIYW
jgi:hypothetical protein